MLLRLQLHTCRVSPTFITTRLFASTTDNNDKSDTTPPLSVINGAIASLDDASGQLNAIYDTIQAPITLPTTNQQVSFKDLILHSRDAHPNDFHSPAALSARTLVLPIAESLETNLKNLSHYYTTQVTPSMEQATRSCLETPCGGASWEEVDSNEDEELIVDTPCERLQAASMDFLKLTFKTKNEMILASRAALIVRLAMELNAPLTLIQKGDDEEAKNKIQQVFQEQVVPTPWLRSEEEYKQLLEIEKEMDSKDE